MTISLHVYWFLADPKHIKWIYDYHCAFSFFPLDASYEESSFLHVEIFCFAMTNCSSFLVIDNTNRVVFLCIICHYSLTIFILSSSSSCSLHTWLPSCSSRASCGRGGRGSLAVSHWNPVRLRETHRPLSHSLKWQRSLQEGKRCDASHSHVFVFSHIGAFYRLKCVSL